MTEWEYDNKGVRRVWNPIGQYWYYSIDDIVEKQNLLKSEITIEKALKQRIGKPKIVKKIIDVMKKLQKKGFLSTTSPQHEDVNLK